MRGLMSLASRISDRDAAIRRRVISQVNSNLERIGPIHRDMVLGIRVANLRRANQYSSRHGAPVRIDFVLAGKRIEKAIWMKQVKSPREVYHVLSSIYAAAAKRNIEGPIPKPYFYDEEQRLIFMDMVKGDNLGKRTLIYSSTLNFLPNRILPHIFSSIGRWLYTYHSTVETGQSATLNAVIAEIRDRLLIDNHFRHFEKSTICRVLDRIVSQTIADTPFPLVRPHNDFTLRNIFISPDCSFHVVDWDAMVHPEFPRQALCWWDLTTLFLNIQSILRIHPATNKHRVRILCDKLLQGYLEHHWNERGIFAEDYRKNILYVLALKYYLGLESDRPLYQIYNHNMGARYIAKLRKALLEGRGDII